MEQVATSCGKAKFYPRNLTQPNTQRRQPDRLLSYERLNGRENSLLQNDAEAALEF